MLKTIHKISKLLFLFCVTLGIAMSLLLPNAMGTSQGFLYMIISTLIFVSLVWVDMAKILGLKKAVWLIFISALIGFISEYLGVNTGRVFGGAYHYNPAMGFALGGVPLIVIAMWTAVVYICYRCAVVISGKKEKFKSKSEEIFKYLIIALLAGLMAVSWDLVWDPLAVKINSWTWHITSPYFGIPLQNFMGWIIVVFLSAFIFESTTKNRKDEIRDIVIPFLGYFYLMVSSFILAIHLNEPHFSLLALILMSPYLLIIVLLKLKKK